jgi:serine/threonine protein phosphatase PrpC
LLAQKSENGDGESLIYGVSSMQGWRISMEDAHATVLDFAGEEGKPTGNDKRLAFFGVYDGHGGDKVALYAGEQLHQIVAKQEAFKQGDIKKALQDGFLATDRAILSGKLSEGLRLGSRQVADSREQTPSTKRKFLAALPQSVSCQKTRSTSYVNSP